MSVDVQKFVASCHSCQTMKAPSVSESALSPLPVPAACWRVVSLDIMFFQSIYPHYGLPLGICSDRGTQWNNHFFRDLCVHLGIELKLTFSYHPRANGQVERLNRVIEEALRHFVGPAHDDWDDYLPHIEFSINSAKCESTKCTPFQLNRITPPLSPTALAMDLPQHSQASPGIMHRLYYHLAKQALHDFTSLSSNHITKASYNSQTPHPHQQHSRH